MARGESAEKAETALEATKLRVGSYVTDQGAPRPFVYVPKDYDLKAHGLCRVCRYLRGY